MKTLDYDEEQTKNKQIFYKLVQKLRPDIFVLMDLLDVTGVNPFILYKVVRQLNNIAIGSGWGEVKVLINNKRVVRVAGEDTEKMDDEVIIKKRDT